VQEQCSSRLAPQPPPTGCTDAFEPNDRSSQARRLEPGIYANLRICAGDEDWFGVELTNDDRLSVVLTGQANAGDLDFAVLSPDGRLLYTADGPAASERVGDLRARLQGLYLVRIYGFAGGQGGYTLEIGRETRSCSAVRTLPASRAAGALELPARASGALSAGGEVFYRAALATGEALGVRVGFDPASAVGLRLYRPDGDVLRPLEPGLPGAGTSELRYGPVSGPEMVLVRVGTEGGGARYDLTSERTFPGNRREGRVVGSARYEDRPALREGLGPPVPAPIPFAQVEVYRRADGYVVATGQTDGAGEYDVSWVNFGDPALAVRILARRRDGFAALDVRRSESCPEIYAVSSPDPVSGEEGALSQASALAAAWDAGGAFNIFAALNAGFEAVRALGFPPAPALTATWERSVPRPCGSCQIGGEIQVGGGDADPDEYDDPVLLHEFAHFYEEFWSRTDSPGGSHDGSRTSPTLAWSEGFATFFSSMVRGDPEYVDTQRGDAWSENIESVSAMGTTGDRLDGAVSENLVAGVLWDLYDDSPGEPFDHLARSPADVLLPTRAYFPTPQLADRGATGVDFVDYLDGWFCLDLGAREEVARILASRAFPYDFAGPTGCRRKPRAPVDLTLEAVPVGPGKAVRVVARAVARAPAEGLRVRVRLPAGWVLLRGTLEAWTAPAAWGDEASVEVEVLPGATDALAASGALIGPGARVRPTTRVWPEGVLRRPPLGRAARSARGRPLFVFEGRR
jgi:hypothetical protein